MVPIYLDYNATTPIAPEVLEAMLPYLREHFGNPSSAHVYGQRAKEAVDTARIQVAALIGCAPDEVVFTGGGTEANNLALAGISEATGTKTIVLSAIEHPAVERPCRALADRGAKLVRLPVDRRGIVDLGALDRALASSGPSLVSVMESNNETGARQPIAEIARRAHARGFLVHTDAAQSVGKVRVEVEELGVDLLAIAGHKLYAPKGVGALYVRRRTPLVPYLRGAGQEGGLRPGTENVAGIVALGAACELARKDPPATRLASLARRLLEGLQAALPELELNGPELERLPNTINVSLPHVLGRAWLAAAPEVAASTGSACHEGRDEPSGVLEAMGLSRERALGAIRLSVGRQTTEPQIEKAITALARAARAIG